MKKNIYVLIAFVLCLNLRVHAQYSWGPVGTGANLGVNTLAADTNNNLLYVGGIFTQAGGLPVLGLAKWDGTNYSPVGSGLLTGLGVSSLLVKSNGNLIAGGTFSSIGGILSRNISEWNGTTWAPIGNGLNVTLGVSVVKALAIYNNELYAAGIFSKSGLAPLSNIAKWDGLQWQPLGSGVNGKVSALCVYNNELYVGGTFTLAGGLPVNNIARWDGSGWNDVGGGVNYTGAISVSALQVYGGALYAGGTFNTAGTTSVRHIARWDGTTWTDPGGGASNYTGAISVSALQIFDGGLVAAGSFDSMGNVSAKNVARWDGAGWSAMGSGMNGSVNALCAVNTTLYAGGLFTTADDNLSLFISQWKQSSYNSRSVSTGATTVSGTDKFMLYPNPNNGSFFIQSDSETIFTITNELGETVRTLKLEAANDFSMAIEDLNSGVYLLNGKEQNEGIHKKIIVVK